MQLSGYAHSFLFLRENQPASQVPNPSLALLQRFFGLSPIQCRLQHLSERIDQAALFRQEGTFPFGRLLCVR
jgi:hypothetical protein